MKTYSLELRDVYRTLWIKADRYEIIVAQDAFGHSCKELRFFVGQTRTLTLCTSVVEKFKYWPVLSDAKRIEL